MTAVEMSRADIAARLLALKVVADWIKAEDRQLREKAAEAMVVGSRQEGLANPADKDTLLGFVQLTKARETASVTDPAALLAWVQRVAPTEVVQVPQIRPAFLASVLTEVKSHGGWISPDGELLAPDGVEIRTGSPVLTVKATAEADQLVADALAGRRLELTPGGAS